jgi:gliding motility-associated-like protein
LATGCIKSDTVTITVKPIPLAIAGSDTIICAGDSITLGVPANIGDTYIWMPPQGLSSVSEAMPVASPEVTTIYTLTETNSLCPNSNTVLITVNPLPAAFTGPDQSIPPHASITIGGPPVAGNTYAWLPAADISSASNSQPEINPMATTTYTLTETIDATGCRQTNTLVITVKEPEFFNAFSPNGDGVNDTWEIPVLNFFPQNKVIILNRWGSEVWETSDYDNKNKVFAGKNRGGDELPDGTYYYNITYGNEEKQGWVLIKR